MKSRRAATNLKVLILGISDGQIHPRNWLAGLAAPMVLLLVSCHLGALLLAGSPVWHDWMHDPGSNPNHHCLVTLLHEGQIELGSLPESALARPFLHCQDDGGFQLVGVVSPEFLQLPGRAPPV